MTFRSPPLFRLCRAAVAAVAVCALAGPAVAEVSPWAKSELISVRLVADAVSGKGPDAALELQLASGWKTYWRSPGEAGIPPSLDFSGSINLGSVEVGFPPPERMDDGVTVSNVYHDRVVLPLTVRPADPARPIELSVKVDLGICGKICVPVTLSSAVTIPESGSDPAIRALLAEAAERLPARPEPGVFAVTGLARAGGADEAPDFEVSAVVPDPARAELFVEGPADWYPGVPRPVKREGGTLAWRFGIDRLGATTPLARAPLRFTLVSGGRAVEQVLHLD